VFKEVQDEEVGFPVNISRQHEQYFKQCLKWQYYNPIIRRHFFTIVYSKGYCTNILLQPIEHIAPWPGFYTNFNKSFFLGRILEAFKRKRLKFVFAPVYYYCVNEFSNNFFHWFAEVLPKMIYVKNHLNRAVQFYFPFALADYQISSLGLCGISYQENKCEVAFFSSLKLVENFAGSTGYYHTRLINETSQLIINKLQLTKNRRRKIYITRKNAARRRILNEELVIVELLKYGFEIFDFDEVSFQQQVEILVNTSILVSLHGAALTNMIFMQPGSVVFELLPTEVFSDKCYFILAGTMKHAYYYLFCEINGPNHITADYLVNVDSFESTLSKIMQTQKILN
jgi:hypothetical protein